MGALHARVAWVQEGHRHQTLVHLADVSRTLADVSFVVFTCVFSDVLREGLRPLTLQVQGVLEPAILKRILDATRIPTSPSRNDAQES